ncbi:MAG: bifunctional hydroxymethylpyrimidine kinase/phosphomethylpyrimidine kinase [Acidobacteria bacterium]|nr:bifunctional hydroxymethylpyrimidine kinase/phosphomethylpyrimidine kinase [Acidobacteriota bacterium]
MHTALTIAGSDPSAGAGIQADLKTFAAFGVYGLSAITAVTVQNTAGVQSVSSLSADLVIAQIEAVAADIAIHATKIGMLATAAVTEAVAAAVEELDLPLVVLDPVLVSTSGEPLLDADGVQALCLELLPRARVVTPNIPEAEVLSGRRIESDDDARDAARRIFGMGAAAVIIKGGHTAEGRGLKAEGSKQEVIDLLFDGKAFYEFRTPRIDVKRTHGTGCTYASAVAAHLALGHALPEAAGGAQHFVAGAIAHAQAVGHGAALLDHFWGGILKG